MPAPTLQIEKLIEAIQNRAKDGDEGARISFGDPSQPPVIIEGSEAITQGAAWEGTDPAFTMFLSGLADWMYDEAFKAAVPVGTILAFNSAVIPDGWALCDGTGGTPDLRDRFIIGGETPGETGGSTTTSIPSMTVTIASGSDFNVAHEDHTHETIPPYYRVVFIIKL